LYKELLQPR